MKKLALMLFTILSSSVVLAGEPDNVIGTITPNYADQDCPILIQENDSKFCGAFKFANLYLQIPVAEALSKQGTVKMAGQWDVRETGDGNSDIFVISFISLQ